MRPLLVLLALISLGIVVATGAVSAQPLSQFPSVADHGSSIEMPENPAGTVNLALVPSSVTTNQGGIFTVTIQVEAGSQQVDGVAAYIDFNPAILQVVDANGNPASTIENPPGNPLNIELQNSVDNSLGHIDYAVGKLSGTKPSGTFAVGIIRFKGLAVTGPGGTGLTFAFDTANYRQTDIVYQGYSVFGSATGATIYVLAPTPPSILAVAGPTTGLVGSSYTFTATVSPPTTTMPLTYTWQAAGQGSVTTHVTSVLSDSNAFTWNVSGTKAITVTASNTGGSATSYYSITIYVPPQADFAAEPIIGSFPLTVSFSNLSTGDWTSSLWNFGDGLTSTATSPSHVYGASGVYTVSLQVSGNGGTNLLSRPNYIAVTGYADLSLQPYTGTVAVGQVFTVAIQVQAGAPGVDGIAAFLNFDPTALRIVNSSGQPATAIENPGAPFEIELLNTVDNANGKVDYTVGTLGDAAQGTFVAGVLRFATLRDVVTGTNVPFVFDSAHNRQTDASYGGISVLRSATGGQYRLVSIISGTVTLQGREVDPPADPYSVPLRVQFYAPDNPNPVVTTTLSTDRNGQFSMIGVPSGTYSITVKNRHTLTNKRLSVVVVTGTTTVNMGTLLEGDAEDNNQVNLIDFSVLATAFGLSSGQPGFDSRADFNESSQVNILDFSLLAANFGLYGDQIVGGT